MQPLEVRDTRPTAQTSSPELAPAATAGLARTLFLVLGAVALGYAFVSGLKTVYDPDFFWQLASGRWIAQHHQVFSTDVFSYTAAGNPWIYPALSELLFYVVYLIGGFTLLSWMGAVACCGSIALLLRKGSSATAAVAIVAVPLIANRTTPRAEMFTVVLFSACLSLLWENYRTGRARLWPLPLLMLAWVNLHPGFVSGVGLLVAFAGLEVLHMLQPAGRAEAVSRLKRLAPWLATAIAATLLNPWGWGAYVGLVRQNRAMAAHSEWFAEWGRVPLSWSAFASSFSLSAPSPFYLALAIIALAILIALLKREFGPAILLALGAYEGIHHLRMQALMGCITIVVGGAMLAVAVEYIAAKMSTAGRRRAWAVAASAVMVLLGTSWAYNLTRPNDMALSPVGTGLGWWFPQRAVEFLRQQKLPKQVFNAYEQGGYATWALGPEYPDYIDGRALPFGAKAYLRQLQLLSTPPDSPEWDAEADRYHINTILLPLHRFQLQVGIVRSFCSSKKWAPVYIDDLAAIFVRRTPENAAVIAQNQIDCATAPVLPHTPTGSAYERFNAWANAAVIYAALGRNSDALYAVDEADQVIPNTSFVPWLRGNIAYEKGLLTDAEREYLKGIALEPRLPLLWFSLATVYKHEGKIPETIAAQRRGIEASTMPQPFELLKLARLYLDNGQPKDALATFEEVARTSSPDLLDSSGGQNLAFQVDQGIAAAWRALGDNAKAASYDQKAVQDLVPKN